MPEVVHDTTEIHLKKMWGFLDDVCLLVERCLLFASNLFIPLGMPAVRWVMCFAGVSLFFFILSGPTSSHIISESTGPIFTKF